MTFGTALRAARKDRGLTVERLAQLGGTSKPAISQIENGHRGATVARFDSLLKKTKHRLIVIPSIANTAFEIAEDVRRELQSGNTSAAYRTILSFSDELRLAAPGVRVALTLGAPQQTGSALYDAALAALVEHWLTQDSLPIPDWVSEPWRVLEVPEHLSEGYYSLIPQAQEVPAAFVAHNVLLAGTALESV